MVEGSGGRGVWGLLAPDRTALEMETNLPLLPAQDCAPGYTRTGSGLYLGHCEMCECNGHSDLCHPETGACSVRCRQGQAGVSLAGPGWSRVGWAW